MKRLHEYKRQHLNVLHIITLYNRIKHDPRLKVVPRTFIFGGKAAPGYFMAKLIIRLINGVGEVINNDPDVAGRLKVVFFPDFNVKNAKYIYPAADLSEQISTAGKEASGTGNMKFSLNGALTIGTLDGANIEIREEVGADNFFLFGLTAEQVYELKAKSYNPREYYDSDPELREAVDRIASGAFSRGDTNLFKPLVDSLLYGDPYLLFADYRSYVESQEQVSLAYEDPSQMDVDVDPECGENGEIFFGPLHQGVLRQNLESPSGHGQIGEVHDRVGGSKMKVGIVGCGFVGSSAAYAMALKGTPSQNDRKLNSKRR